MQYLTEAEAAEHSPEQLRTHSTAALGLRVEALRPHARYTFTVLVRAGTARGLRAVSRARSAEFRTREAPPAAPADFRPLDATPSRLTFVWRLPPQDQHGELRRFLLDYAPQDQPDKLTTLEFPPDGNARSTSLRA